tara:strand:+ start:109 stop:357 length:249 start_codon:yes stop_codon:yes gene_type:complete
MCSPEVRKEANRYFWIIKGHLIPQEEPDYIVEGYYESYFKRLWNNESGCIEQYEKGFEEAYETRIQDLLTEEMKNVASLGYD